MVDDKLSDDVPKVVPGERIPRNLELIDCLMRAIMGMVGAISRSPTPGPHEIEAKVDRYSLPIRFEP